MTHDGVVCRVQTEGDLQAALAVRKRVFVDEQGVPPELEVDDFDRLDAAIHFVARDGDDTIGAARLRPYDAADVSAPCAKVERVAVLTDRRGEGFGARLMDAVEAAARDEGFETLVLHAQRTVEDFYAKRGYRRVGEEFHEAGIPHIEMRRRV